MPTLQWMSRDEDLERAARVPYRLLEAVREHGGGDADAHINTPNMLIQGDNLEALKSLLPFYAGKVKCIYIDPPYNTGSAFEHYDDNLEHSQWLSMMWPRLELLRELLSDDGSIWIQLDDRESHYAKVILDEIFGRRNFVANVVWKKTYAVKTNAEFISTSTEHVMWYTKNRKSFSPNKFQRNDDQKSRFKNPDNDPRGPWQSITFTISLLSGARGKQFAKTGESPNLYELSSPSGDIKKPPEGRCWAKLKPEALKLDQDNRLWWGEKGDRVPRLKMFLSESKDEIIPNTLWADGDSYGYNQHGVREVRSLDIRFPTPKPERLIERLLHIATNPGDLVLDSFLGSGTTAAVAHKMSRRWIGLEMGDHAVTHCVPRLRKVIDGEQGGISDDVDWKGGGAFRFYKLGEPVFGADGRIREGLSFNTLAAHVWFSETHTPLPRYDGELSPFLGRYTKVDGERGLAMLYNGVLGDKSVSGGNVLTSRTLEIIRAASNGFDGPLTIYGERSAFGPATLERENIIFRQTPYDVAATRRS